MRENELLTQKSKYFMCIIFIELEELNNYSNDKKWFSQIIINRLKV